MDRRRRLQAASTYRCCSCWARSDWRLCSRFSPGVRRVQPSVPVPIRVSESTEPVISPQIRSRYGRIVALEKGGGPTCQKVLIGPRRWPSANGQL